MGRRATAAWFAGTALIGSALVGSGLGAGHAGAATPVAQASGTAVSLTIAGQKPDTGTFQAVDDGTQQTTSGSRTPAVTVLGGHSLIQAGTLAQDATTSVVGDAGHSAACAGMAGQGATVASVGDSGSCLTPGQALTLSPGTLDLGNLQIVQSSLLQGFDAQLTAALQPVLAPLTSALQTGLTQAVSQLGLQVGLDLGAVQSSCTAGPGTASGSSHLAGASAYVVVGGQRVSLLDLPADPAPNAHLVTNLGDVADVVETAVKTQLSTVLSNLPGGATLPPGVDQTAVLNNALSSLGQQLQPLQDNVLDVTLNRQTQASADSIEVTALDVSVLPVGQQLGVTPFDLAIGTSSCGPDGRVAAASPSATPSETPFTARTVRSKPTAVPTQVPAGVATASAAGDGDGTDGAMLLVLGGLAAIVVGRAGAAWAGVRRPD